MQIQEQTNKIDNRNTMKNTRHGKLFTTQIPKNEKKITKFKCRNESWLNRFWGKEEEKIAGCAKKFGKLWNFSGGTQKQKKKKGPLNKF